MNDVHRYRVVKMLSEKGNKIGYDPHGPEVVLATDYDALAAERDRLENELAETELRALRFIHQFNAATDLGRGMREAHELIAKTETGEECRQIAYDALEPFRARAALSARAKQEDE